jgi:NDP-sugar pyrophosphorylase family protein
MTREALLLTAGLGTRLRPLTDVRAKPAMPVAGEPLVRRIIRRLASAGVTGVVLNLHHLPHTITAVVGDGADLGIRARYSWEPRILGSAGGPRLARPIVGADPFWIVNGDTLTDVDLAALESSHAATGALVTLALVPNAEFERYGGVRVGASGEVLGFVPRGPAAEGSFHYIGVQLVAASVFDGVPAGEPAQSIGGIYDRLIAATPGAVRGFITSASFFDVGTAADYWRTCDAFANAAGPDPSPSIQRGCRIDQTAHVTRSILWDDVQVEADAVVDECIVTDGARVPAGAQYRRKILIAGDSSLRAHDLDI